MIPVLLAFSDLALFILRVVFAGVFLVHGVPKIKNLKSTQEWFGSVGFKPGWFWGTLAALLETVGAALILLGLGTQPLGFLLAGQMAVVTLWKMKNGQKLSGGYELDLLLMAIGLILATMGGGALALGF
ncbi:MAG: DoxX family protein [bacterium]|jgi:putative oxidoreductase|nr:DoxX family protein [bacterium]